MPHAVPSSHPTGSTPIRVLHLAATANGAAWMHQMVRELRDRGYVVSAGIGGTNGTLAPRLERDRIPFHIVDLDIFSGRSIWQAARKFLALVSLLRRERPDVLHTHLYPGIIVARVAAWVADVPVRLSMIPGTYYLEAPTLGPMDIATAPFDSAVIASCEYTRTLYRRGGVADSHVELIFYGQDASLFDPAKADGSRVRRELGLSPDQPVVGDVAYFYPPSPAGPFTPPHLAGLGLKGHEVLLRAMRQVRASVPDVACVLVGDGWGAAGQAYMRQVQALARELGVDDVVRFVGARSDIPDTLTAFDVSVQCSLNENLGGSIESLLMQRPLVASDVGGLPDAVRHERTGLLVPPGNADALAAAIVRLLQNRAEAARFAAAGRAWALERLTLARTVDDLDRLYRRLTAKAGAGRYRVLRTAWRLVYAAPWMWWHLVHPVRRASRPVRTAARPCPPPVAPLRITHMAACRDNAEWFAQIVSRLQRSGRTVTAVVASPPSGLSRRLTELGVVHASTPLSYADTHGRLRQLRFMVRSALNAWRLARSFRQQRVHVVHTHVFESIMVGRLAAWLARVPCRISMVPGPLHLEAPISRWLDRLTCWMDTRVIAASRATYDMYRAMGVPTSRLAYVPYGVDASRFDPERANGARVRAEVGVPAEAPLIGLVAHFYPPRTDWQTPPHLRDRGLKGHEDFLAAARLIRQARPEARFILVGQGTALAGERYRQTLMAQVAASDLADAVIFTGHRTDVPDVLAAVDVAVQCSLSENHGGTIESLLMARPTVATRVGGMPETVQHEVTGLLVPPADPAALAAAVLRCLDHPDDAARLAAAGRAAMLAHFTIERTVEQLEAIYSSALAPTSALARQAVEEVAR